MEEKLKIIRDILGAYRQSSNEFLFQCPFCGHHKKENVGKFWYQRIQMLGM